MFMGSFGYILVTAISFCITGQALGLECAVCLPPDENIPIAKDIRRLFLDDHSALIGCHQVNASDENAIIRTCPLESASCHIQKTKDWTAKTCSKISVDDQCQTANRVKYCYCKTNRCNLRETFFQTTTASTQEVTPTTSSNVDKSSSLAHDVTEETTTTARPKTSPTNSASSPIRSKHWLMVLCLLIIPYESFTSKKL